MINSERTFYLLLSITMILGALFWVVFPKGEAVLWLNAHYSPALNVLFKYTTYLGDGVIIAILALILLLYRYYAFAVASAMGLLQLVVVQGLKKLVFGATPRPSQFFENHLPPLHFVEGVDIHHTFSMPSGHTTTAFSVALLLILLCKPGKKVTGILFIVAFLTGISRVYLAQHFLADVLFGAFLGTFMAKITYEAGEYFKRKNPKGTFFTKSVRELFR